MLVKRLYIRLDSPAREILCEQAEQQRRHPADEAALILERELLRARKDNETAAVPA
jgi:hypothetical protein